jgi:hypothetical protein
MRSYLLLLTTLAMACATSLTTMQPADTLQQGDYHVGAGTVVNVPASRVADALEAASDLEDTLKQGDTPTEDQEREYFEAAAGLALNGLPQPMTDVMIRYGALDRFDVGLRLTSLGFHVDGKYQFLRHSSGWNGSISLGYANHKFEGAVFKVLKLLDVKDFSRHDIEVPLIFGKKIDRWGYFWAGPKYVGAKYHIDGKLADAAKTRETDGFIHYVGGFTGFGIGYQKVYVFLELAVMNMIARPTILDEEVDIGGIIVQPAIGAMARF